MNINYRQELNALSPYVPGRPAESVMAEYGLPRVIKLASNENPYGMSPAAKQAAINALSALYPDGACSALRSALSAKLRVPENCLAFGAGADELIAMLAKAFVSPGDECVTAAVTFPQYAAAVLSMGGTVKTAPMTGGLAYDLDGLLSLITPKTKIVFIANPNNPTGTAFTAAARAAFLSKVPSNVLVVLDEAYAEFADIDFPASIADLPNRPNVVVLRTFSKAYGLASLRVGYAAAAEPIIRLLEKIRCPFNVSAPAQAAAVAALADEAFLRETVERNAQVRQYTQAALAEAGIAYIPSQANFALIDVHMPAQAAFERLMRAGYITRPAFGLQTHLRVTFGLMDDMRSFMAALKELLDK